MRRQLQRARGGPGCAASRRSWRRRRASVYGLADTFPTGEDHHPYNNRTWYGASKIMLEGLLRSFNDMYGLPYVALRYFNVYGPRMDIHGKYTEVLIRWMERIAAGQPPLILGDGTQTMDFVYIEDVARANILALQSDVTRRGVQRRERHRDEPERARRGAAARSWAPTCEPEYGPERKVNPVSRRLADTTQGASDCSAFERRSGSRRACAAGRVVARAARAARRR